MKNVVVSKAKVMITKENIIIVIAILVIFLISFLLARYKANPKYGFFFSIVAILVFIGIFINEVLTKPKPQDYMLSFLLTLSIVVYLVLKAFRNFKALK